MRFVKLLLGAGVFVLAVLALAGVIGLVVPLKTAVGLAAGALVALSSAVTLALRRSLRRLDSHASALDDFLGLSGVCALVVLGLVLAFGRGAVVASLTRVACDDAAPPFAKSAAGALATWLAPPHATESAPAASASASTAPPGTSAVASAPPDAAPLPTPDASHLPVPDAAPIAPPAAAASRHLFADLQPCDYAFLLYPGDFDGDKRTEIVVWCLASVHVLSVTPDDKVVETFRFVPAPPAGLVRHTGTPSVVDVDGDGKLDLLLCTTWTTTGGGTRGGASYLARGDGRGRFEELVTLAQAPCNGIGLHDVTGDGTPELVTLHTGNPWDKTHPNGAIAWATGKGTRWSERGSLPTDVYPSDMTFGDFDGDGIDDVLVWHGWDSSDHALRVYRGSKKGLVAAPADAGAPPPEVSRSRLEIDVDGDGALDEVVLEPQAHVSIRRSARPGEPVVRDVTLPPPR